MGNLLDYQYSEQYRDIFEPVPPGWYAGVFESADIKNTKDGKNRYIEFKFLITEGDHENRTIFDICNYFHTNTQAKGMADKQMNEIVFAQLPVRGTKDLKDTSELLRNAMIAYIAVESPKVDAAGKSYPAKNTIKRYLPYADLATRSRLDFNGKPVDESAGQGIPNAQPDGATPPTNQAVVTPPPAVAAAGVPAWQQAR